MRTAIVSSALPGTKNLFNKYNDMKGVSSVYISKAMMELNPNLFMKDLYIGKVAEHLNSVQVLSTHDNKVREEMAKDIRSLVQSSKYELLMKQKVRFPVRKFM